MTCSLLRSRTAVTVVVPALAVSQLHGDVCTDEVKRAARRDRRGRWSPSRRCPGGGAASLGAGPPGQAGEPGRLGRTGVSRSTPSLSRAFLMVARTQALVLTCRSVRKRARAAWMSGGIRINRDLYFI